MRLGEVFERFLQQAPISVMFRALLERALDPDELDRLFEQTATRQYTRELLFSSVVDLMGPVVCGVQPSVRAAYLASLGEIAASLTAVYEKLKGIEPGVCRGLRPGHGGAAPAAGPSARRHPARAGPGLPRQGPRRQPPGRHRAPRQGDPGDPAAPLPGQALVVLDPATMLVIDVVPCEDAHAQERSLIDQVLPGVEPGDLWIADRNFCTTRFLFGVRPAAGASWCGSTSRRSTGRRRRRGPRWPGRHRDGPASRRSASPRPTASGAIELRRIRLDWTSRPGTRRRNCSC